VADISMALTKSKTFYTLLLGGYYMKSISLLSLILLIIGCDNQYSRKELVELMKKDFAMNKDMYNFIEDYFTQSKDSVASIGYDFSRGEMRILKIPTNENVRMNKPFVIKSFDEIDTLPFVKNKDTVIKILEYLKSNEIMSVSGTREWVYINHKEPSLVPCFSVWYRKNFNPNDDDVRRKINNFSNVNTTNWIFLLGDGWYIQGEKCF